LAMLRRARVVVEPDMNVTPLVDVVLVLLIIFMVVAPQLEQDLPVNLPGIFNVDPEVEGNLNPLKVSMAQPGQYHIDEQQFDLEGVLGYLREQSSLEPRRRLLLRADASLQYGDIRQFMSRVQAMGFPGLNFMVGERHREGAVRATADYATQPTVPAQPAPADAPGGGVPADPTPADPASSAPGAGPIPGDLSPADVAPAGAAGS